jgi:hypothetical protein
VDDDPAQAKSDHRCEAPIPVGPEEIARILDARPAGWVSSFLQIAALWAGSLQRPTTPPWFRLGSSEPRADGDGRTASFVWRPHLDGGLFSSFRGCFVILPTAEGSTLVVEGTASGGTAATNERVLSALVEALGSALAAGQAFDG